jgi:hypothetical protein
MVGSYREHMTTPLTATDREAMERAIATVRSRSESERAHIDHIVAQDGWERGALYAAYDCQDAALKLKPWQAPPCWLRTDFDVAEALASSGNDVHGWRRAARLLRKLERAGLSRFEPDPLAALERVASGSQARERDVPKENIGGQ